MSRRLSVLLLSTWLSLPTLALAEDLPPEKLASIRRDEKHALEKVNAAHGGKKSSEMSTAERRQMIQEQQQATQGVLDKHGVSSKDYARQTARMGPKQNAQVDAAEKALEARTQGSSASSPGEIPIERGWGSEQQVEQEGVEGSEGAMPVVEHGLPTEEQVPAEGMPSVDEAGAPEVEPAVPAGEPAGEP
ncbi:hypothetical protein D187_004552 [Cystobacter fuscus DSM 2262]|uniref:DUF4148 domain-containing protein n=1 Tax=Cystobacter fuscus (strain ATCC 25194 / DSM 2262 / NBRC 100088 / M29) TaxID=1242864 RepID=S9R646_CYSF2|nr:hypothetical protein [Cystobacter fuscus]EPX64463.1 hypothetical protein D187_004552 [Cystobacter fuscus DSM 2262]